MTGQTRSKLVVAGVFAMTAIVVIAGMVWASLATLKLTERNIVDAHERNISKAVSHLDMYIGGLIVSETSRRYEDYHDLNIQRAVAFHSDTAVNIGPGNALVRSPLAKSGPPHEWIDMYFWIDKLGTLMSPQIQTPRGTSPTPSMCMASGVDPTTCDTWQWLHGTLPHYDLTVATQEAIESRDSETAELANPGGTVEATTVAMKPGDDAPKFASEKARREYYARKQGQRKSQIAFLPPAACVAEDVAATNLTNAANDLGDVADKPPDTNIQTGEFATPFVLEPDAPSGTKLAFVRPVFLDGGVAGFQGFVGDWTLLQKELTEQVRSLDLFEEFHVELTRDEPIVDLGQMVSLPVELHVAGIPGGSAMAAWRQARPTLFGGWSAAAIVLIVAGLALRNLVALTERRMRFAYAVTHELRTPLTTFRLYSDMLSAGLVPSEKQQEYLDTLNTESQRLTRLVEGVLEYARLENQKVRLNPVRTDADSLLSALRGTLEERCEANGILPEASVTNLNGAALHVDVDVVNRIVGVLVNNACRYTCGRENPTIALRLGQDDGDLTVDVIDTGPGIDRRDARAIFKPFRRGHGADKAAHGGIGLGLALARSWATLLGGRLELAHRHHPTYGGAHFRLRFPVNSPTEG